MEKMTQKQIFALGLVALEEKGINAYVAIEKYATQLKNNNIDTQKINSINATFAITSINATSTITIAIAITTTTVTICAITSSHSG